MVRPRMVATGAARSWDLPALTTTSELATWLGVTIPRLEWFADLRELNGRQPIGRLQHYVYRALAKRAGRIRLIEAPKRSLKEIQRLILSGILAHIPVHDAAHGFRAGRSIKTFAESHVGRPVSLRMDSEGVLSVNHGPRVFALCSAPAGVSRSRVADLLTGLITHSTPRRGLGRFAPGVR